VIEASEAVKERFMEPVVEIATELGNDGRRLIEKLTGEKDDTRLSRFQKKTTIKLALYLETNGYLDPRPVLSEPELRVRVLASPAARSLPEAVSSLLLDVWWQVSSRH
jgi:exonuclease SbcC